MATSLKWLKAFGISILAIFAPIQAMLTSVAVLVALDMISGIWAAYKHGEKITSSKMRQSLTKIVIYEISLLAAFIAEKYLLSDFLPIVKIIGTMVASSELKSLYENMSIIGGNDLLKNIAAKIGAAKSSDET